jgi:hypothetical protein
MNDEQRLEDERIAMAAREVYNAPPATPRDEMWSAIEARLEAGAAGSDVEPADRARPAGRLSWWIGVAAALVIGLGLGRLSLSTGPAESQVAARPEATETTLVAVPDVPEGTAPDPSATEPPPSVRRPSEGAAPRDPSPEPSLAVPPDFSGPGTTRPQYVAATREHLNRSESFLTGVRVDLAAGSADADFGTWARSLLSRTRLLLASPAGRDPDTRRLLEDLELMLAQVIVTAATSDPAEARLLGEGLESGDLLRRMRSATSEPIGPGDVGFPRASSL